MINALLNGCNGRMGQSISRLCEADNDIKIVAGIDIVQNKNNSYTVYDDFVDIKEKIDVIIDFSNIKLLPKLLKYSLSNNLPVVICTTGQTEEDKKMIRDAALKIPILTSANMSVGVNLILKLVADAAKALEDSFDIEIIEKHHNQKLDSPSGTALAIADSINSSLSNEKEYIYGRHSKTEKRQAKEIGIHAVRGGNIVGDHSIVFAGAGEVIEINHSAISRDVFAVGAIKAAKFLYNKKAKLYNMNDVLGF